MSAPTKRVRWVSYLNAIGWRLLKSAVMLAMIAGMPLAIPADSPFAKRLKARSRQAPVGEVLTLGDVTRFPIQRLRRVHAWVGARWCAWRHGSCLAEPTGVVWRRAPEHRISAELAMQLVGAEIVTCPRCGRRWLWCALLRHYTFVEEAP